VAKRSDILKKMRREFIVCVSKLGDLDGVYVTSLIQKLRPLCVNEKELSQFVYTEVRNVLADAGKLDTPYGQYLIQHLHQIGLASQSVPKPQPPTIPIWVKLKFALNSYVNLMGKRLAITIAIIASLLMIRQCNLDARSREEQVMIELRLRQQQYVQQQRAEIDEEYQQYRNEQAEMDYYDAQAEDALDDYYDKLADQENDYNGITGR